MRNYPILTLTEKGADFLRGGHVWVFADEVTHITGTPEDGALADVCSPKGKYLGTGFYNSNSKIRVRIISKNANDRFGRSRFCLRPSDGLHFLFSCAARCGILEI